MKIILITDDTKIQYLNKVLEGIERQGYLFDVLTASRNKKIISSIDKPIVVNVPVCEEKYFKMTDKITGSIDWNMQNRFEIAYLRNYALELDNEIFFVDGDVVLPKNAVNRIINVEGDVIMGWYFFRDHAGFSVYMVEDMGEKIKKGKPFSVAFGGIGCSFFRNIKKRFDLYGFSTEDVPLLKKIRYKKCLPDVYCEHLGYYRTEAREYKNIKEKEWGLRK